MKKITKSQESNNMGGFLEEPFGGKKGQWNIDLKKKIFECGDKLKGPAGNKNDVLYQVWFRGRSVTKEAQKSRESAKPEE